MRNGHVTRRGLVAAGSFGAAVAAGFLGAAAPAGAAEAAAAGAATDEEAANLALVHSFIDSWAAKDFDADKVMAEYFAPDCHVRPVDSQPALTGPAALAAMFKGFMAHGERVSVAYQANFASGPVVVTRRIDTMMLNGKAGQAYPIIGVFMIKNGKIQDWTDYVIA